MAKPENGQCELQRTIKATNLTFGDWKSWKLDLDCNGKAVGKREDRWRQRHHHLLPNRGCQPKNGTTCRLLNRHGSFTSERRELSSGWTNWLTLRFLSSSVDGSCSDLLDPRLVGTSSIAGCCRPVKCSPVRQAGSAAHLLFFLLFSFFWTLF